MALLGAVHAQQPATQQQAASTRQPANIEQTGTSQQQSDSQQQAGKSQPAVKSQSAKSQSKESGPQSVTANLMDAQGKQIGKAMLMDTPAGLLLQLDVAGLPPGEHGFHVHSRGLCEPKEGFKTAGEHFSPRNEPHGFFDKKGATQAICRTRSFPRTGSCRPTC